MGISQKGKKMTQDHGARRFGAVNWLGLWTLARREIMRFWAVKMQTVLAPLVTSGLFLFIFSIAIGGRRPGADPFELISFLAPGLMMMSVIQNSYANTSSSLMIAKMQGNIVDTLMPPLSPLEILAGYVIGGVARGFAVAFGLLLGVGLFLGIWPEHIGLVMLYTLIGGLFMAFFGLIGAMHAEKFDQLAAVNNFFITPLSFLSGTFYSISALPEILETISYGNPFFYLIDGMRYAMIGTSDASVGVGLLFTGTIAAALGVLTWHLLRIGYRIKA